MRLSRWIAWLPVIALPAAVVIFTPDEWPRWAFMWLLAFSIFAGCKWLTWASAPRGTSGLRQLAYLAAWPGLDAAAFLEGASTRRPRGTPWLFAAFKIVLGLALIFAVYPRLPDEFELTRGWIGMIGILLVLHFGLFDGLSLLWQSIGIDAKPIMDWPLLATSVSEFWGRRWNAAFRDLTHRFLFRPLAARWGARVALAAGFVFSGLLHDLVISVPARGGFGGPTLFFLVQPAALFLERSEFGARLGLGSGVRGWAFTMLVLALPLPLLFHPPFVREVIVPFLDWVHHE